MDRSWFKPRNYLHFDSPITYRDAINLVTSPSKVAKHSFYPFLSYTISSPKIKKDENGNIYRSNKDRNIAYSSHQDSHIFSYYSYILNQKYELLLENKYSSLYDSVLAFRKLNKNNIDFAKMAFQHILDFKNSIVIALDISSFFDNLDHGLLKRMWCMVLGTKNLPDDHYAVFKAITKFSKISRDDVFEYFNISSNNPRKNNRNRICTPLEFREFRNSKKLSLFKEYSAFSINKEKGIPQGSPISALLSNIYMLEFDLSVKCKISEYNGIYLRYCDDILCIIPNSTESLSEEIETYIVSEMNKLKLEINQKKKDKVLFYYSTQDNKVINNKGLQYLGFILHNNSISIRPAAFSRYSNKMKKGVSLARQTQGKYNKIRLKKGMSPKRIYKRKLYSRYSHFGKSNFISYGKRSQQLMGSNIIRKQLKPLWFKLVREIEP